MAKILGFISLLVAVSSLPVPGAAHMIEAPAEPATLGTPGVRVIEGPSEAKGVKITPAGEMPFEEGTVALPGHKMRIRFFEVAPRGVFARAQPRQSPCHCLCA